MALGTLFFTEYTDVDNAHTYRVKFLTDGIPDGTQTIPTKTGCVIEYDGDENMFEPVVGSTCTIDLFCESAIESAYLEVIAQAEEGTYLMQVERKLQSEGDGLYSTIWSGVVLGELFVFEDHLPQVVQVQATDDLGNLANIPYLQSDGTRFEGSTSILGHLTNAIKQVRQDAIWSEGVVDIGGVDYYPSHLAVMDDFTADNYSAPSSGDTTLLANSSIAHSTFYKDDSGALSCLDVITNICQTINCRFFQVPAVGLSVYGNTWVLMPIAKHEKIAEGTAQTFKIHRYDQNHSIAITSGSSRQAISSRRNAGWQWKYQTPLREVNHVYKYNGNSPVTNIQGGTTVNENQFGAISAQSVATFDEGTKFRIAGNYQMQWFTDLQTWYEGIGNSGTAPAQHAILRVRLKIKVIVGFDSDTTYYLKRTDSNSGNDGQIFADWYNWTSTPQTYKLPQYSDVEWSTSETTYNIVLPPFDASNTFQTIQQQIDIITPPTPTTAEEDADAGIRLVIDVEPLLYNYTVPTLNNDGTTPLFPDVGNHVVTGFAAYNWTDGGTGDEKVFTKTLDTFTETLTVESLIGDGLFNNCSGALKVRTSNGTFQDSTGWDTSKQSYGDDIHFVAAEEIMRYRSGTGKRILEGTYRLPTDKIHGLHTIVTIVDGASTYACMMLRMAIDTNLGECEVQLRQLDRVNLPDTPAESTTVRNVQPPFGSDTSGGGLPSGITDRMAIEDGASSTVLATASANAQAYADAFGLEVDRDKSSQTGAQILQINADSTVDSISDGTAGQYLKTNGSGVFTFSTIKEPRRTVAAHAGRVLTYYASNIYYGSSTYGWAYHYWSSLNFNTAAGNPYARTVSKLYAFCGVVAPRALSNIEIKGIVRNDTDSTNVAVFIGKVDAPDGTSGNMQITQIGLINVTIGAVDVFENFEINTTTDVAEGQLIFVGFGHKGSNGNKYLNFSYSISAT